MCAGSVGMDVADAGPEAVTAEQYVHVVVLDGAAVEGAEEVALRPAAEALHVIT